MLCLYSRPYVHTGREDFLFLRKQSFKDQFLSFVLHCKVTLQWFVFFVFFLSQLTTTECFFSEMKPQCLPSWEVVMGTNQQGVVLHTAAARQASPPSDGPYLSTLEVVVELAGRSSVL